MDIFLYTNTFFHSPPLTVPTKFDYNRKMLQFLLHCSPSQFSSLSSLRKGSETQHHAHAIDQLQECDFQPFSSLDLYQQLNLLRSLFVFNIYLRKLSG